MKHDCTHVVAHIISQACPLLLRVQEQKVRDKAEAEGKQRATDLQNYKNCFDTEAMTSNKEVAAKYETAEDFEDDFM